MAGETETEGAGPQPDATRASGGAAFSALGAASQAEADAFLREQTLLAREQKRLTELQSQNLTEQNSYELSHLRWRRFNDQMKGALQIMTVAMGALVVVLIAATMWNASRAAGLVVETFSVPPAYVTSGVSGAVLADDLTNAVGAIRDKANATSLVRSNDVRQERDDEIRVEIPETGVSVAQAWRYLRRWLGHERRLNGNLRSAGDGTIALTVALDGERAFTVSGAEADLAKLEQQAAERVFESVDPNNYVIYLLLSGRPEDCMAAAARYAQRPGSPTHRAETLGLWAGMTRSTGGDLYVSMARARAARAIDPKVITPHMEIMGTAVALSHDEEVLHEAALIPTLDVRDQPPSLQGASFTAVSELGVIQRDLAIGDFGAVMNDRCNRCPSSPLLPAELSARLHDVARSRALVAEALASGSAPPDQVNRSRYFADAAAGEWATAVADARAYAAPQPVSWYAPDTPRGAPPLLAYALARTGDFAGAEAAIAATPFDCYGCLNARGQVAGLKGDWTNADAWFVRAIAAAPSIPFAYADRGEMLLRKGDLDAAIAQFALAHQKGPHFADPLELWGEALMAKNRPDLALAKFEEAATYAPNWGRLHLKWSEALFALHRRDEARKQLAAAAALALTPEEAIELSNQKAAQTR